MPLPPPEPSAAHTQAVLDQLGVLHFDRPIFEMGSALLGRHFSHKNRTLHESLLLNNLIWQDLGFVRDGTLPPFSGNIRTYWYQRAKPTLDRAGASVKDLRETLYNLMIARFSEYVGQHQLFAYREFGFRDSDAGLRRIGSDNPHIVVVAEKEGQLVTIERLAERFGCTIIALGGSPSLLATEYFANDLHDAGLGDAALLFLTLVDFDPAGDQIATSFINQMMAVGFGGRIERLDMALPHRMTMQQLRLNKFSLGQRNDTKRDNWKARTGGGLLPFHHRWGNYGFEADAMTQEQIEAAFVELAGARMEVPIEQIERRRLKVELVRILESTLLFRLLGPRI